MCGWLSGLGPPIFTFLRIVAISAYILIATVVRLYKMAKEMLVLALGLFVAVTGQGKEIATGQLSMCIGIYHARRYITLRGSDCFIALFYHINLFCMQRQ